MIHIEFGRKKYVVECEVCGIYIPIEAPSWDIRFGVLYNDGAENVINLCEDCGNNLQNDMVDEYQRFIDLKK